METEHFSLNREYDIPCKLFKPNNENINNVIIGVHGFAGDKDSSVLEELAKEVCRKNTVLICFDFPVHGDSPVDGEMLTVENCKKDLCFVMEYITKKYPEANKYVFATSFGGFITLLCSEKFTDFKLVLRAPAVTMPKVLLENVLKISEEDFKKMNTVKCGFERPIDLPYSFYKELMQQESFIGKEFTSQILIIHGNRDDIVPLDDILTFAATKNGIAIEIIEGADHRFKNRGELEKIIEITTSFMEI